MRTATTLLVCMVLFTGCSSSGVPAATFLAMLPRDTCESRLPPSLPGPSGDSLRILVAGDAGEGPEERGSHLARTIEAMKKVESSDALLLLGDNVYQCGMRSTSDPNWERVIAPLFALGVPIYPVLGNHDWGRKAITGCTFSNPSAEVSKAGAPGFELWQFPAPAYVITTDVAELILFDSSPIAYGWPDHVTTALCAVRAALAQPKQKPWRIVVGHHPLFSCGDHGGDVSTTNMRAALHQLMGESGVDLYVSGHDHNLELAQAPGPPAYLVSGSASKIRRRGARCPQGGDFKIEGGFAVLTITADDFRIAVYCNGKDAPCMERRLEAR